MTSSPTFCSNLRNRRNQSNFKPSYVEQQPPSDQKSGIDRKSYAWFHHFQIRCVKMIGSRVKVLKSLNDRQAEFRGSSEPIMFMIILQYVNWEVSSDLNFFFSITSIGISRIAVRSWHQSHDILPIKHDACSWREIFSTRKCGSLLSSGFTKWRSNLTLCGFVLLIRHIIAWIWPVRFPKFVKTIVPLWKLTGSRPKNVEVSYTRVSLS